MAHGKFIISLDFELGWGFHDISNAKVSYENNILGARSVIPNILSLFRKYNIHATWATVGALSCASKRELLEVFRNDLMYEENNHSLCVYIEQNVGENEKDDPLHYATSLIRIIQNEPNQFMGSHTYSHFFTMDKTKNQDDFETDIKKVLLSNPKVSSMVLPRNQVTANSIIVLKKYGFKSYRGCQYNKSFLNLYQSKASDDESLLIRLLRLIDAYIPFTGYYGYSIKEAEDILNIQASCFLRPYSKLLRIFEPLKIQRIKTSLSKAAKNGDIFHLWWHPHNFGCNQKENLDGLEKILKHYKYLNVKYGMRSYSMEEINYHVQ